MTSYWHKEGGPDPLTDYDLKSNEYVINIRAGKLLSYQSHLFKVMKPKKAQIDINLYNLPMGVHYSNILQFLEFYGVHTEPKQIYVKVRGLNKDKCLINWYHNYDLAWKIVSIFGAKFSGKNVNIELPDYERSLKQRSNTFDQFLSDFDNNLKVEENKDTHSTGEPEYQKKYQRKSMDDVFYDQTEK